jgi:hypothetical protein
VPDSFLPRILAVAGDGLVVFFLTGKMEAPVIEPWPCAEKGSRARGERDSTVACVGWRAGVRSLASHIKRGPLDRFCCFISL